ncbi:uncharacterized protein LOC120924691 isoform X1 [Rana temporaria]|uniref:uncharacterized protein LOC120924691 isoform X1 n=1 Tax=Rana temporaria TaxID=8407 RepID=UPI001AAD5004|nr:uncharacterized protein LOC120924691 isoform X1 [Rana temporaria]
MPGCFVPGCSYSWRRKDTILHIFPKKEARIRLWLQNMNVQDTELEYHVTRIAKSGREKFRICSKHFSDKDYVMGGQGLCLRFDAIPTLQMPPALEPQIVEHFEHNYYKRQKLTDASEGEVRSEEPPSFLETSPTSSGLYGGLSMGSPEAEPTLSMLQDSSEHIYRTDSASPEMVADEIEVSTTDFFRESLTTSSRKKKLKGPPKQFTTATRGADTEYFPAQKHKAIQTNPLFMKKNKKVQASVIKSQNSVGMQCDLVSLPPLVPWTKSRSVVEKEPLIRNVEPSLLQSSFCDADLTEQPKGQKLTQPFPLRYYAYSEIEGNATTKTVLQDESYRPSVKEEYLQDVKGDYLIDPTDPDTSFFVLEDQSDQKLATERKFIVFESCLNELLLSSKCKYNENCLGKVIKIKKYLVGSALVVEGFCGEHHRFHLWSSQPFVGKMPAGNLLLSGSILGSGSNFRKVSNFFHLLGLCGISQTTYYKNQNYYLFPIINHHWCEERKDVISIIGTRTVALAGDGQCDSPGSSAKYCTYTFLDMDTDKIIDFQVEPIKTGASSTSLEKIAFEKALQRLKDDNLKIKIVATDRHGGIRKMIKEQHNEIRHEFHVWHFAKSIGNKLHQASKRRNSHELSAWVSPAKKHLWWCASTCNHNVDLLKEKWMSLVRHSSNAHSWTDGKLYKQCSHEERLDNEEEEEHVWLLPGSAAHQRLKDVVLDPRILKDLEHLSNFCHAGNFEVFHSRALKYRPKHHHFEIDGMVARTQLAALDHNRNVGREQAGRRPQSCGAPIQNPNCRYIYSKAKKDWTMAKMYDGANQEFMIDILTDSISLAAGDLKVDWIPRRSYEPENIAHFPCPEKPDMLQRYLSRFNH